MIYVLAGTFHEAATWAALKRLPKEGWRYVASEWTVEGTRGAGVVCVGTWQQRDDLNEVRESLRAAECVRKRALEPLP